MPTSVISCITGEGSPAEPLLHIVIIWRRDNNHIKYEWLPHTWNGAKSHEWNETRDHLELTIQRLLHASGALSCETVIKVRLIILIILFQFCTLLQ
jgi:DnaJ family protein C protein 16